MSQSLGQLLVFIGLKQLSPTDVHKLVDEPRTSRPKPAMAGPAGRCLIYGQTAPNTAQARLLTGFARFGGQKKGFLQAFRTVILGLQS